MSERAGSTIKYGGQRVPERPVGRSIKRGLKCRCPNCGDGRLFGAFLKPVDHCSVCGEDYRPQRADDLPAYLVIIVVGHVLMSGYMLTDMVWRAPFWVHAMIWIPLAVLAAIATIQPIKGGVIGLQWANRMHGFAATGDKDYTEIDGPQP
jgi:uncharacterized protein (DUF983 family)